jgi:hypothetical protein
MGCGGYEQIIRLQKGRVKLMGGVQDNRVKSACAEDRFMSMGSTGNG